MDEIPELLKGTDAMLQVKSNPTQFRNFEIRYTTKGGLQLTTFHVEGGKTDAGKIAYAIQAGEITKARTYRLSVAEMQSFRSAIDAALQKLNSIHK